MLEHGVRLDEIDIVVERSAVESDQGIGADEGAVGLLILMEPPAAPDPPVELAAVYDGYRRIDFQRIRVVRDPATHKNLSQERAVQDFKERFPRRADPLVQQVGVDEYIAVHRAALHGNGPGRTPERTDEQGRAGRVAIRFFSLAFLHTAKRSALDDRQAVADHERVAVLSCNGSALEVKSTEIALHINHAVHALDPAPRKGAIDLARLTRAGILDRQRAVVYVDDAVFRIAASRGRQLQFVSVQVDGHSSERLHPQRIVKCGVAPHRVRGDQIVLQNDRDSIVMEVPIEVAVIGDMNDPIILLRRTGGHAQGGHQREQHDQGQNQTRDPFSHIVSPPF